MGGQRGGEGVFTHVAVCGCVRVHVYVCMQALLIRGSIPAHNGLPHSNGGDDDDDDDNDDDGDDGNGDDDDDDDHNDDDACAKLTAHQTKSM